MNAQPDYQYYDEAKSVFLERDAKLGKKLFSASDWGRTKVAYEICSPAKKVIDIGIGQGQLINALCATPGIEFVKGVDRTQHTKLILPKSDKFQFVSWDITNPTPESMANFSDVTVCMEVFEHIDVDLLPNAIANVISTSKTGMMLASVPYREEEPLYHHDKPHGHKQSFDDEKMSGYFGEHSIFANFRERWYFIFSAPALPASGMVSLADFRHIARTAVINIHQ